MLIQNKTIWTPDNSFLLKYKGEIEYGKIIVGQEMWQNLENLEEFLKYDDRYYYDTETANLRMNFMEHCVRLTKSPFYNQPMVLMLWQKALIEATYSFKRCETGYDKFQKIILLIARKNTKALALNTRIPTLFGDRTIRDIKVGDYVFSEKGIPIKVLSVSEVFKNRTCYKVIFEDGEEIVADENHKWTVQTKESRRTKKYVPKTGRKRTKYNEIDAYGCITITTSDMVKDYERKRKDGKGTEYKYRVPISKAVQYKEKELFSPYVLGLWLGDGDKHDNRISTGKEDLETLLKELKKENVKVSSVKVFGDKYEVRIGETKARRNTVREEFRRMGIWKNKRIPKEYLTASVKQRWELLKGLMDTDGTCSKAGQCMFSQKDGNLARDVSKLLSSLGIKHNVKQRKAICNGKDCGYVNYIGFFVDKNNPCFRYQRKIDKLKQNLSKRMEYKSIVKIERVENQDTKCITVDNERGLFLCGEKNTVTHNSETCSALGLAEFITGNEGEDIVCSSNDDNQASIVYDAIDTMRLLVDPKGQDTGKNQRFMKNKNNGSKIFKLSDKTKNKEGRNIDFAIVDETHEMKENIIGKAIEQSQSLKESPKFFNITTEGFERDGYLDQELEFARKVLWKEETGPAAEVLLPWLYTQDSEEEVWQNRASWVKANPTLGIVKQWSYLDKEIDKAKTNKADRIFTLSKDFNIKQNSAESWLNLEDYDYEATYDLKDFRGAYCLGAVDLSETTDLTCAKVLLMKPGDRTKYIHTMYFLPEAKVENEEDKNAGARYREWTKEGYITTSEGNDIDLSIVADWFYLLKVEYDITLFACGYDQKFAKAWINRMEDYGWTKAAGELEIILQNAQTLDNAMKLLEADLKSRIVNYNENPVDQWCFKNAAIKVDEQGRGLCVKKTKEEKIDGAVTNIILYEMYRRHRQELKEAIGG